MGEACASFSVRGFYLYKFNIWVQPSSYLPTYPSKYKLALFANHIYLNQAQNTHFLYPFHHQPNAHGVFTLSHPFEYVIG